VSDYGCPHPGMPLCRKQSRRSRDAPMCGLAIDLAQALKELPQVYAWEQGIAHLLPLNVSLFSSAKARRRRSNCREPLENAIGKLQARCPHVLLEVRDGGCAGYRQNYG